MIASRLVNAVVALATAMSLLLAGVLVTPALGGAAAFVPAASFPQSPSSRSRCRRTNESHGGMGPAFLLDSPSSRRRSSATRRTPRRQGPAPTTTTSPSSTALQVLLDVPDGFFTVTFPVLGILLGISKNFARVRMEENAWEQRLAEGRAKLLAQNPTLTELDLRRMEAEREWSAYGAPRMQQEKMQQQENERDRQQRRRGVTTAEREGRAADNNDRSASGVMSVEEIEAFEAAYGVEYDPYYDDPYAEDELPPGKFQIDKRYGDRIYEDGEIFYKTSDGMYYRQGAKPRSIQFW